MSSKYSYNYCTWLIFHCRFASFLCVSEKGGHYADTSHIHMYLLSQLSISVLASWMLGLSAGLMSSRLRWTNP